jgi:hypothetical protein
MISFEGIVFTCATCLVAGWIGSLIMDRQKPNKKRQQHLELGDSTHDDF